MICQEKLLTRSQKDLLVRFTDQPLLDRYDVYQRLMYYWSDTMQDDVYLIAADGWVEAAKPRSIVEDKERKIKETPDLTIGRKKYKMDLVPPQLIVAHYFAEEQSEIDALQEALEKASSELDEFVEEHSGNEGLLVDALNEKGKITKVAVKDLLKAIEGDVESDEERDGLTRCLALIEVERRAGSILREARAELDEKVLAKYAQVSEAEIKVLVVDDKWFASIRVVIEGEVQTVTQQLAVRVKELKERYAQPLPMFEQEVELLNTEVQAHLAEMGIEWR